MEGKTDSMTAKEKYHKRSEFFVTPASGSLNKGDLFLLLAITSFIQGARFVLFLDMRIKTHS